MLIRQHFFFQYEFKLHCVKVKVMFFGGSTWLMFSWVRRLSYSWRAQGCLCSRSLLDPIRKESSTLSEEGDVTAFDGAEEPHTPGGKEKNMQHRKNILRTVDIRGRGHIVGSFSWGQISISWIFIRRQYWVYQLLFSFLMYLLMHRHLFIPNISLGIKNSL